jgi:hypothetical protein
MDRRIFLMASTALLVLPSPSLAEDIPAKLYKDPNCGCCSGYGKHLSAAGFAVEVIETAEFAEIGRKAGVPEDLEGCHAVFIGDYVVSGHVPIEVVQKVLAEKPAIAGVTLAGMPAGSPGLGGDKTEAFTVYAFTTDGKPPTIYATV